MWGPGAGPVCVSGVAMEWPQCPQLQRSPCGDAFVQPQGLRAGILATCRVLLAAPFSPGRCSSCSPGPLPCRAVFLPAAKEQPLVKGDDLTAKAANNSFRFMLDLAAGGTAGGISKTVVAPIERVKLLLQTQHSNPRIKSGEIAPYTGEPPGLAVLPAAASAVGAVLVACPLVACACRNPSLPWPAATGAVLAPESQLPQRATSPPAQLLGTSSRHRCTAGSAAQPSRPVHSARCAWHRLCQPCYRTKAGLLGHATSTVPLPMKLPGQRLSAVVQWPRPCLNPQLQAKSVGLHEQVAFHARHPFCWQGKLASNLPPHLDC